MDHKAEQLAVLAQNVADLQEELRSIGGPSLGWLCRRRQPLPADFQAKCLWSCQSAC
jgi:hypothetical protein